jgi:serine/threonine protein phosphatase PrpC
MNISSATAQGERYYQEDRSVISKTKDGRLVAVMDGHGGYETAQRLASALASVWKKHVADPAGYETAILNTFADLNTLTKDMGPGAVMSLVFIPNSADIVWVAVLGDAPVIVLTSDGLIDLSPQHNARSNKAELKAAQDRGAFYSGGYIFRSLSGNGIQMTRVFGDRELNSIVNRVPEVYSRVVNQHGFVLVGSDGLFDPSNLQTEAEVAKVVALIQAGAGAQELVDRACAVPTGDNVTAILIRIGNKKSRKKNVKTQRVNNSTAVGKVITVGAA